LFLISISLVLTGCSSEDESPVNTCQIDADCSALPCATCQSGQCQPRTKENCCGNAKCDASENECTCQDDCGTCISTEEYLSKECDESNACISSLNFNALTQESQTMEIKISENILSFTPAFDNPFIFGYSKLNIKIQADKLDDKTHFVINRIKVYDKLSGSKKILLSEKI